MTKRKVLLSLGACIVASAVFVVNASGSGSDRVQASTPTVSVKDDFFSPKSKSVSKGGSVKWNFRGTNDHNVTFKKVPRGASKRGSGDRTRGDRAFTRSFSKAGTYKYVCTIHEDEGMRGTVTAG